MNKTIQVFEWESLRVGQQNFTKEHHTALHRWQDLQPANYFQVQHNAIKFTQWVGVIQVGSLTIEVLPKADKNRYSENADVRVQSVRKWKGILIEMLRLLRCCENRAAKGSYIRKLQAVGMQAKSVRSLLSELLRRVRTANSSGTDKKVL